MRSFAPFPFECFECLSTYLSGAWCWAYPLVWSSLVDRPDFLYLDCECWPSSVASHVRGLGFEFVVCVSPVAGCVRVIFNHVGC